MAKTFGFCLNTGTVRGHKLGIVEQVDLAARAGYGAIEPWIDDVVRYRQSGESLRDLSRRIADAGLAVPSAIGFAPWLVDRRDRRAKGLQQARHDMDLVRQIGGTGLAAPPAGMIRRKNLDPRVAAERYRALLDVGRQAGVVPMVELWGFSRCLCRLGEVVMIAIEAEHPDACVLLDVYHLYKGGSNFAGLRLLGPNTCRVLHMNDYPAGPTRPKITDADRVYPGDGVAPLKRILTDMRAVGFHGWLSLELFNKGYWQQPALKVARTGLSRMQAAARTAGG